MQSILIQYYSWTSNKSISAQCAAYTIKTKNSRKNVRLFAVRIRHVAWTLRNNPLRQPQKRRDMPNLKRKPPDQMGAIPVLVLAIIVVFGAIASVGWHMLNRPHSTKQTTVMANKQPTSASPKSSSTAKTSTQSNSLSSGWHITTYYTVVESYHNGSAETVTGCSARNCADGSDNLGNFPSDFVEKVKNEGAGLITSGSKAGMFLNWSFDTGYWIDTIASDSYGSQLQPFVSAAADSNVLPRNTTFKLSSCGTDNTAITTAGCSKLEASRWHITDQFTPGLGGAKHIDLYIGKEDRPDFENSSDTYVDLSGVDLTLN